MQPGEGAGDGEQAESAPSPIIIAEAYVPPSFDPMKQGAFSDSVPTGEAPAFTSSQGKQDESKSPMAAHQVIAANRETAQGPHAGGDELVDTSDVHADIADIDD